MVLAIDFSQYLAPIPKTVRGNMMVLHATCMYYTIFCHKNILCRILIGFYCLLEYLIKSTFGMNSTRCGKQFDSEAQTVCIGCQR